MNKTYHPYNPYWYHDHKEMLKNMKIQDLIEDAKHQPHKKSISHKNIAMDMGISACIQPDEQLTEYYNKKYNLTFYFLYEEFVCYGKQTSLETNEYFYWTSKQDYQNVFYYIRSLIVKNPAYKSIKFDTIIEQMNATCEIETKPTTSVEYSDSIYDEDNLNETLGKFETAIRYLKTTSNINKGLDVVSMMIKMSNELPIHYSQAIIGVESALKSLKLETQREMRI